MAGGLVAWAGTTPTFCADAVADPLTGLTAANACLDALARGGRWLLDVSMAGVSAGLAGPALAVPREVPVADPRARAPERPAPALGADTARACARNWASTRDHRGDVPGPWVSCSRCGADRDHESGG